MSILDSFGNEPDPLQQRLFFDTSEARQEAKDFASTVVTSLKEAEDEARRLAAEFEKLAQARKKFEGKENANRQRVNVVDADGNVKQFTQPKLEAQIKAVEASYLRAQKAAQDLAKEQLAVNTAIQNAAKANELFSKGLEQAPQNITKVKAAYGELETQIDRLKKIQFKSPAQEQYLKDLQRAYKLSSDELGTVIDLEEKYAQVIKQAAEADRKRQAEARAAFEARRKEAAQAEKNARTLKAIESNPQIRPDRAFDNSAQRSLRESGLRAVFNSPEFQQSLIRQNVQANVAAGRKALESSKFNVNDIEKQVQKNIALREKEADAAQKAAQKLAEVQAKAASDAALKVEKAVQKSADAQIKADEKAALSAKKLSDARARAASDAAEKVAKATEKKATQVAASKAADEEDKAVKRQKQAVKDAIALQKAQEEQRQRELNALKADIIERSRLEKLAADSAAKVAKATEKAANDRAKAAKKIADTESRSVASAPKALDKEVGNLTVQYLRAQKALEALQKQARGFDTKAVRDAAITVNRYREKLTEAAREADKLGIKTANVTRAQAALSGALEKTKSPLGSLLDFTSKLGFAFFGIQTAMYALLAPVNAINAAFIETNRKLEQAELALAATFNNNFVESFSQSMQRAKKFVTELRDEAVRTNLTFEELQQVTSQTLPQLLGRGATSEQALEISSLIAQQAKIQLGDRFEPGRVNDEVRALLNKQIVGRTNETIQSLGITQADLKPLKDVSELLDLIRAKTKGLQEANAVASERLSITLDNLKDKLFQIGSVAGKPLFETVTRSVKNFLVALESGKFQPFIDGLEQTSLLLSNLLIGLENLAKIGDIKIGFDLKLGEVVTSPLGQAVIGGIIGGTVGGPIGVGIGASAGLIASQIPGAVKLFNNQSRRDKFNSNRVEFSNIASDTELVDQIRDLTVKKYEIQGILDNPAEGSRNDPKYMASVRARYNDTIAGIKLLEQEQNRRAGSTINPNPDRRFDPTGLGTDKNKNNQKIAPKRIVEGIIEQSEIEKVSKTYREAIREIESSNKELQASLDAIDPGGLVAIQQAIQSTQEKITVNSSARDKVLELVESLDKNEKSLRDSFNKARSAAIANPADNSAAQKAQILLDKYNKARADLEKGRAEFERLDDQFLDLQAELANKQTEQRRTFNQQRVDLAQLNSDLTDIQNSLTQNTVQQAFDLLGTSARRSGAEIKNLKDEIARLEENLIGVSQVLNGKTVLKTDVTATPEQNASIERLNFARLELSNAEKKQLAELNQLTRSASQEVQTQLQTAIGRVGDNRNLTQRQRDSFALTAYATAQKTITGILNTGVAGGKDITVNGLIPPETFDQLKRLQEEFENATLSIRESYQVNIVDAGKNAFDSLFDDILNGTASVTKTFKNFLKDIATQFERLFSAQLFDKITASLGGSKGPTLGFGQVLSGAGITGGVSGIGPGGFIKSLFGTQQQAVAQGVQQGIAKAGASPLTASVSTQAAGQAGAVAGTSAVSSILVKALPLIGAAVGFGSAANTIGKASREQRGNSIIGGFGGATLGAGLGAAFAPALTSLIPGIGPIGAALLGAGLGSSAGSGFGASASRRKVAASGAGALAGGLIGGLLAIPTGGLSLLAGASLGAAGGGLLGSLFGGGKRQAETMRNEQRNTTFANSILSSADANDLADLNRRLAQVNAEWSRQQKAGKTGKQPLRDAAAQLIQQIKDLRKRAEEATKQVTTQIEELSRPGELRGIVPEVTTNIQSLKDLMKIGVDKNKIFELFNLQIRDSVEQLQSQLDGVNKQLTMGAEDEQGRLITLSEGLQRRIAEINEDAEKQLQDLREGYASQASAIIGEGRASAIIPSAASRQQRLALLAGKQNKSEAELKTETTNAILRDTNQTNRDIADLQKDGNKILSQISLLLNTAITMGTSQLGISGNFLQGIQSFLTNFNQYQQLALAPAFSGGIGINIDNLVIPPDLNPAFIGQQIVDAINAARQSQYAQRTAQSV